MAEVTLVTDKDHAVPVQVERSGVRSVLFGAGTGPRRPSCASWRRRPTSGSATGCVTSGIDGTYPAGLAVAQVDARRARHRADVRADHRAAARRRRPQRAPAGARRRARRCRRGRRSRPTATPRRRRPRQGRGAAEVAIARTAATHAMFSRAAALTPARPEEILRPVEPVVHRADARCSRCSPTSRRPTGVALALRPDFLALVLLYWCIQEPRYVGVGVAWALGLVMDVADATVFGQHALAYAVLAYAAEYFRRRVLRFPLWQQAAQVAVLLLALRGARAARARRRRRAAAALDVLRAAARRRAAVAAAVGAAAVAAAAGARLAATLSAPDARDGPPPSLRRAQRLRRRPRLRRARAAQRRARACSCSAAGWSIAGVLALAAFAGLFARFVYLQVVQHEHYQTLAETNRIAIVPIVPNRGVITDRNGVVLAQSYSAYTLEITPSRDQEPRRDDRRARRASSTSQPRDRKRFRKLLEESKNFESLPLRTRLSDEEVARFAVNRYRFPGVEIKARLFRQYPFGEVASHVIGYIGRINDQRPRAHRRVGRDRELQGLRLHRQGRRRALLRARAARHHRRRGGRGRRRRPRGAHAVAHAAGRPATTCGCRSTSGCSRWRRRRSATGAARWSRSIPRPATCSRSCRKPGFDPNLFVDGIDSANWEVLNESPDKPLLNRPLRGAYPPGSTIKPFLALGALTSGKRTPTQTIFDPGFFQLPGLVAPLPRRQAGRPRHRSTCTSRSSCPATRTTTCSPARPTSTTPRASCRSSASAARPASTSRASCTGVLPSREWKRQRFAGKKYRDEHRKWYLGDSISAGIGQGYNAFTPIQLAHAIAIVANDGVAFRPHLVQDHREPEDRRGARGRAASPRTRSRPKPEHLAVIKNALVGVNKEGTSARGVRGREVRVGRQDRHRAGVLAQGREVRGAQGRRAAARPRVVHRLRAGRQAEDRARGAGRERRLRRAGGGADRAQGARLLPARRAAPPGPAPAAPARRQARTRATDADACRARRPRVGGAHAPHRQMSCSRCALAHRRRRARHAVLRGRPERGARHQPAVVASASRWC